MASRTYEVTFRESAIVTERVEASNAREAKELIHAGEGERVDFQIDETRAPTRMTAKRCD